MPKTTQSEYRSEYLTVRECILHIQAKSAIRSGRYSNMKVNPVDLENLLISLDQTRKELYELQQKIGAERA